MHTPFSALSSVVMLSEQPSPPTLRLPPPPPQPTPAEIGIVMDDFSSESSEYSYVSSVSSDSDSDLELESEVKKQKLNEEEGKGDDDSSDSKKLDPLPMTPDMEDSDSDDQFVFDDDGWKKYSQQLQESEGFDIKDYPGADPRVTIFPRPNYLECPNNVKMMKYYAAQALKLYNQKFETLYEVNDILKVNGDDCGMYDVYYITFTVTNGEKEYFQAKVVERLGRFLRISIIRPRANGASGI
ncbi:uncharacterized protein LOC124898649 [Capsicum annuum]|uniref:uncharacterized protein LOC124898649 n=1 Tax=Capsicum annuum TaxID=4072 RepID=UPI001FB1951A|nr:uncharacterized protein LOC124898649 [Capsicum annuum]